MSRIFKRLHGIIERVQGSYKYLATAYGKEIIAAGLRNCDEITHDNYLSQVISSQFLTVKKLVLIPALA